jgi:hypothetical protein
MKQQREDGDEEEYELSEGGEDEDKKETAKGKNASVVVAREEVNNAVGAVDAVDVESFLPKDSSGKIVISVRAYNVEGKKNQGGTTVGNILGSNGQNIPLEQSSRVLEWFNKLRTRAAAWYRDRCIQLFLENAARMGHTDYDSLEALQDAWAAADNDEQQKIVGKRLNDIFRTGYFGKNKVRGENGWKYEMEKELMEEFGLSYLPNEVRMNNRTVPCLARQASRSRADIMKRVQLKGKLKHGAIISKRVHRRDPNEKRNYQKKGSIFDDTFVRKSEPMMMKKKGEGGEGGQGGRLGGKPKAKCTTNRPTTITTTTTNESLLQPVPTVATIDRPASEVSSDGFVSLFLVFVCVFVSDVLFYYVANRGRIQVDI